MWFWIILCGLLALSGFTAGGIMNFGLGILFAFICIIFIYEALPSTQKKRREEAWKEAQRKKSAEIEKELRESIIPRFQRNSCINSIICDLRNYCYNEQFRISIYPDRIVSCGNTWYFDHYGYQNMTIEDCRQLAYYLRKVLPNGYNWTVDKMRQTFGPVGINAVLADVNDYRDKTVGYLVYDPTPKVDTRKKF